MPENNTQKVAVLIAMEYIYAAIALFQHEMVWTGRRNKLGTLGSTRRAELEPHGSTSVKFCGNSAELADFRREQDERNANIWRAT